MIKITHRFGIGSAFGFTLAAALLVAVLAAPAVSAGVAQIQERGTFLGPKERETLSSWTGRWLEGPIQYIATEEEQDIYNSLESTTQRLQFIRMFWERRDPSPRGPENEYLEEFVRRAVYAEEEFGDGQFGDGRNPGWATPFGQVVLVLGPPVRTEREPGLPRTVSQRPAILWGYDARIPEWPTNEKLLFVFQRGRWKLYPPSNFDEPTPSASSRARDLERTGMLPDIPNDFVRATDALVQQSLLQSVRYDDVINNIEAEVIFPDADIPFAWEASFEPGTGGEVQITVTLTWRMEALVFHTVEQQAQTEMVLYAVLMDDDAPVAENSEHINVTVPAADLASRKDEFVERSITLSARPGSYSLTLSLDDQLLGFRTVYRNDLVVPER